MITTFDSTGAHAAAKNRRRAWSSDVRERGEPVEEDLDEEDPGQRGAGAAVLVGVDAVGDVDREQPEDPRRSERPRRR